MYFSKRVIYIVSLYNIQHIVCKGKEGARKKKKEKEKKKKGKKRLTKGNKFGIISRPIVTGGHERRGKAP